MLKNIFGSLFERWPSLPYVLFGIFYAWLDLMVFSPLVLPLDTPEALALRSDFQWLFFIFGVAFNLICIFAHKSIRKIVERRETAFPIAACMSACTLLCLLLSLGWLNRWLIVAAALLGALGQTYITVLMVLRFYTLSGYQVFINIALLRINAAVLYFFLGGLPRIPGVVVLLLLPPALALATQYSFALNPIENDAPAPAEPASAPEKLQDGSRTALVRVLAAGFALSFAINSAGFGGPEYWPFVELLCAAFAMALVVLLVYRSAKKETALSYWFYATTVAVLLAFCIAAILPVSAPVNYLVCGSFRSVFDAFFLGFLIIIAKRSTMSPVKLTGLFYGCYLSAVLAGLALDTFVKTQASLTAYSLGATVFAILTLAFLLVAFTPKDIQALLGVTLEQPLSKKSTESEQSDSEQETAAPSHSAESSVISSLTEQYALSSREREVLSMLLQGYTANMISDALFISPNTTKTHMHNLYSKMGVKSREELVKRAQRAEQAR